MEFRNTYLPYAFAVGSGTGILPEVLIAQWGVETAWGSAINNKNNLGNIRCLSSVPCVGGFSQFPSLDSFVANCIAVFQNGFYTAVLAAKLPMDQIQALAASPWDAGHYGNPPGSSLLAAYHAIGDNDMKVIAADPATIPAGYVPPHGAGATYMFDGIFKLYIQDPQELGGFLSLCAQTSPILLNIGWLDRLPEVLPQKAAGSAQLDVANLVQAVDKIKASTAGAALTPAQAAQLAHIEQMLTQGLKGA
jgi:hypothetical protein